MNSKFLLLAILAIQLSNASIHPIIAKNENLTVEIYNDSSQKSTNFSAGNARKKAKNIKLLKFSSSEFVEINGTYVQQLKCINNGDRKKLCNRYNGTYASCENKIDQNEQKPKWMVRFNLMKCEITGMNVTNKNVIILAAFVTCYRKKESISPRCVMSYVLDKNDEYNIKDDSNNYNKLVYDPQYVFEYELDDETKETDIISTYGIEIAFLIGFFLVISNLFFCFWSSRKKKQNISLST